MKRTSTVHVSPIPSTALRQVVDTMLNSLAAAPVNPTPEIISAAVPQLVTVTL